MLDTYFSHIFDAANFFALFFLSATWTLLENKPWQGRQVLLSALRDLVILFAAFLFFDIVLRFWKSSRFLLTWLLAQGLVSAIYVFLHQEDRSRAGIILWSSMYAGSICLVAIGGQVSMILAYLSLSGGVQGLIRAFSGALSLLLAIYLNARRFNRYDRIPLSGLVMILTGNLCLFILRWLEYHWFPYYYSQAIVYIAAYLFVLLLVLCAVYAVSSICRDQARILALTAENQRAASEKSLYQLTEKQLDDLRQLRHDVKNQYAYMGILLEEKRYDELRAYFDRQTDTLAPAAVPLDCGNRSVSIILNMERQKADAAGVALRTKLVVPPALPFPDNDLCSLLANLIDNAIDECVRLGQFFPRRKEQGVEVSIHPRGDYLTIEVRNPTDRKKLERRLGGLLSTKADPALHGYGTRIVTRLAEKYNGSALFETAEGQFTARVMLDMMMDKEGASL